MSSTAIYYQAAIDWILLTLSCKFKMNHGRQLQVAHTHTQVHTSMCTIMKQFLYWLCVMLPDQTLRAAYMFPLFSPHLNCYLKIHRSTIIQPSLRFKKNALNLWGPVRGSFTSTGAQRALDLAEVRLPLGRSLQGLLVLLIAGHDRSTPVQPELLFPRSISLFLLPHASVPFCTLSLSYLPPLWPISSPLFYPPFLYRSLAIFFSPFPSLPLSALLSD